MGRICVGLDDLSFDHDYCCFLSLSCKHEFRHIDGFGHQHRLRYRLGFDNDRLHVPRRLHPHFFHKGFFYKCLFYKCFLCVHHSDGDGDGDCRSWFDRFDNFNGFDRRPDHNGLRRFFGGRAPNNIDVCIGAAWIRAGRRNVRQSQSPCVLEVHRTRLRTIQVTFDQVAARDRARVWEPGLRNRHPAWLRA